MLGISNDTDSDWPDTFAEHHRFLNTDAPDLAHYGDGIGLDVADSFFFKSAKRWGIIAFDCGYPWESEDAYAAFKQPALDTEHARDATGQLVYKAYHDHIIHFARHGWIDALHGGDAHADSGYEQFSSAITPWKGDEDGLGYYNFVTQSGLDIPAIINHDRSASNFGDSGNPEFPALGDVPGDPHYWAGRFVESGGRFGWVWDTGDGLALSNATGRLDPATLEPTFGTTELLVPKVLRDGQKIWQFARYVGVGYNDEAWPYATHADTLFNALSPGMLDLLWEEGRFELVYVHLAAWYNDGTVTRRNEPQFPERTVAGLRRLRRYQDEGKILVARQSRVLRYSLARKYAEWTETPLADGTAIDIRSIADPQFGTFVPTLDEVRGLSWYVLDAAKVSLCLGGNPVPEALVLRSAADDTGRQSVGIRWFDYDRTDYTVNENADDSRVGRLQPEGLAAASGFAR